METVTGAPQRSEYLTAARTWCEGGLGEHLARWVLQNFVRSMFHSVPWFNTVLVEIVGRNLAMLRVIVRIEKRFLVSTKSEEGCNSFLYISHVFCFIDLHIT
jgi:hypothetical protein